MASSDVAPLPVGIILYGYRIDKVLGQGGFGITYLGTKQETNQVCVIKENIPGVSARRSAGELQFHWADNAENAEGTGSRKWSEDNFIREATRLTQLRHRGIVTAMEAFRSHETGTAYYTMPYVSSESLSSTIRQNVVPNKEWVLYLLASLLDSLQYVHSLNMLHRDIKPENILMSGTGEPIIIDFGSARATEADHKTRIVSANYSPIEQMRGEGEGPWTDIYALAASLYQVMTGEYVPQLACRGGKKDAYVPMATRQDMVARYGMPLMASMDKALAFEPEDRYRSAAEWAAALGGEPAFQFTVPVLPPKAQAAPPVQPVAPTVLMGDNIALETPKAPKKSPLPWVAGGMAALVLAGGIGWYLTQSGDKEDSGGAPAVRDNSEVLTGNTGETVPVPANKKSAKEETRVVVRSGAKLYDSPGSPSDKDIAPFSVYYSKGEKDGYLMVSGRPGGRMTGLLKKEDVYVWPYNLVIDFNSLGGIAKRDRSLFFNSSDKARDFITGQDKAGRHSMVQKAAAAAKGGDLGDLESKYGVVAIEPEKWGGDYRLLPVLDHVRDSSNAIANFPYKDADGDVESSVLKIAAMTSNNAEVKVPAASRSGRSGSAARSGQDWQPEVDVVFVVDTTRSMGPYIESVRNLIAEQAEQLHRDSNGHTRFGLVAYRDWKYDAQGMPDTSVCGYVTKNYNESAKKMFDVFEFKNQVLEKVTADGSYDFNETTIDSVDCAEDMLAGVHEAVMGMPWRDAGKPAGEHNLRLVILIGDAPGRETDIKESDKLCLGSKFWKQRAIGSYCNMDVPGLASLMSDQHVNLMSFFILTPPPSGISEKLWKDSYLRYGVDQFKKLSYCDPSTPDEPSSMVIAGERFTKYMSGSGATRSVLGEFVKKASKDDFNTAMEKTLKGISKYSGGGMDMDDDEDTSAAKKLFAGAYVEWLSKQAPGEGDKTDMEGWTQDTNDERSESMVAKIVLSRKQLEGVVQKLDNVIKGFNEQNEEEIDNAVDGAVAQMYTLVSDPNVRKEKLGGSAKSLIGALPFRSNLLNLLAEDNLRDASVKAELFKDIKSRAAYMKARLSNDGGCIPDPQGNKSMDLFLVPVNMLP